MVYSRQIRKEAETLHKNGFPYSQISVKLGVAKSTLSTWIGASPRTPSNRKKQRAHLARARVKAAEVKRAQRQAWITMAHQQGEREARKLTFSVQDMKAMLAMLYWSEGAKYEGVSGIKFVNTDPKLLRLYMALLRIAYPIQEVRLRARLHLHHYHNHKEALKFWSSTLSIPESQFGKIYVKKRSRQKRFRKNSQGICFVYYFDSKIREEILSLGRSVEALLPRQCLLPSFNGQDISLRN